MVAATPNGSVDVTVEEREGPLLLPAAGKEAKPMPVLEVPATGSSPRPW